MSEPLGFGGEKAAPTVSMPPEKLAQLIDHTLLKPDATSADIQKLCDEARRYSFFSVCVNPSLRARRRRAAARARP